MFFLNILCNWKHVSINSSKEKIVLLHDSKELIMQRFKFLINIESTWKCGINEQTPQLTLQWQYCHKQPPEVFYKKSCSQKFHNIHVKTPVWGFLFNKVVGLQVCNFFKKRLQHRCFLWIQQNFLDQIFRYSEKHSLVLHIRQ